MDIKDKITEQPSHYDHLEQMSVSELLRHINEEDCRVAAAVRQAVPQIQAFVETLEQRMKRGGRLLPFWVLPPLVRRLMWWELSR